MRWTREPLVHFLVLGLLLFAGYAALHRDDAAPPEAQRIDLTVGDLRQLEAGFAARWRRLPTPDEMVGMVEGRVREEIMYREALALGLDKDDAIVKRRMAQKMEFLAEDSAAATEPGRDQLQAWFGKNAQRFASPPQLSFRQIYFSPDRRGERARVDAAAVQQQLAGLPADASAPRQGDAFMFRDGLADQSPDQVAKNFGPGFARALFALPTGSWQGPIESGYGWHVVLVSASSPGRVPSFEEVEPEVAAAWKEEQRTEALRQAYDKLRAKYEVALPAPRSEAAPRDADAAAAARPNP